MRSDIIDICVEANDREKQNCGPQVSLFATKYIREIVAVPVGKIKR